MAESRAGLPVRMSLTHCGLIWRIVRARVIPSLAWPIFRSAKRTSNRPACIFARASGVVAATATSRPLSRNTRGKVTRIFFHRLRTAHESLVV